MTKGKERVLGLVKEIVLLRHSDEMRRKERIDNKALTLAGVVATGLALFMGFAPIILGSIPVVEIIYRLWAILFLGVGTVALLLALTSSLWASRPTLDFMSPDLEDWMKRANQDSYSTLLEALSKVLVEDVKDSLRVNDRKAQWLRVAFIFSIMGFLTSPFIVVIVFLASISL